MKLRPAHARTGERGRIVRRERSRRLSQADLRDEPMMVGGGWSAARCRPRRSRRRRLRLRRRRRGGMWLYARDLRSMRLRIVRMLQRGGEREIAELFARNGRNIERLKREAWFQEALRALDFGAAPERDDGVPRALLDPAAGGRGKLPPDWEPLDC